MRNYLKKASLKVTQITRQANKIVVLVAKILIPIIAIGNAICDLIDRFKDA